MGISPQAKGLLITLTGVLALCPDTLLVRLLDMEKWSLLFYRGIMLFFCLSLLTILRHGRAVTGKFAAPGLPGLALAILFTISTISFVLAIYLTTVANTLIILSSASMFAALFGRFFLNEQIPPRTYVAACVVVATITYIVSGSIGGGSLRGDGFALLATITSAGTFTIMRHHRAIDMTPATALSGLLTAFIAWFPANFTILDTRGLIIMLLLCLLLALSFALLTMGPRYISAAEVSLLMPLETVIAPLLIWLVIGEEPATTTLIGGPVVVLTLLIHSLLSLQRQALPINTRAT